MNDRAPKYAPSPATASPETRTGRLRKVFIVSRAAMLDDDGDDGGGGDGAGNGAGNGAGDGDGDDEDDDRGRKKKEKFALKYRENRLTPLEVLPLASLCILK